MANDDFILPYKLGFAAVTAAIIFSASESPAFSVPERIYDLSGTSGVTVNYWEDSAVVTLSDYDDKFTQVQSEINVLHAFAANIIENAENIKPEVANIINKRFWDMLA